MESAVTGSQETGTTNFSLTLISSKKVERLHLTKALYSLGLRALRPLHPLLHHLDHQNQATHVHPEHSLTTPSQEEHRDASHVPLERIRIIQQAVTSADNVQLEHTNRLKDNQRASHAKQERFK